MEYRTCTYIHDDGGICNSAAVTDRNLCLYHLRHRARLMRMAQYRARGEHFDLILPPLESTFGVQSALTQLSEALAADMIELKRADRLIRVLNIASRNLLKSDKWPASPYHSDQPAPAVDLTADFGLPNDLDLNLTPELAFPPPPGIAFSDSSSRAQAAASADGVEGPASSLSPMPTVAYCKHGPGCSEHTIRADYPETAELAELREIQRTQGDEAMGLRHKQQQRNRRRRHIVTNRKRYAAIALEKNMRLAAERLAEQKLAGKGTCRRQP
ncbi:MAG TPA: hypothetical protein VFC15_07435 [Candidatus Limnocylindrales bacterium]|nr:hypothetical protein [Candidatus Limnocylindrales bacterium]